MKENIILFCIAAVMLMSGCSRHNARIDITSEERDITDSIVASYKDAGDLDSLLRQFTNTENTYGRIAANRALGKHFRHKGLFSKSIEYHRSNVDIAIKSNDTIDLVEALNNIGTNYRRMGILDEASSYHHQALELCERYSDKTSFKAKKNRVISLNGLGNVYLTMDNHVLADSIFRLALNGEKELNSWLGQAINYANIGALFESDGKTDSAMFYYTKSLECNKKCNSYTGIALCHTHFGRLYEKDKKWDAAIKEYRKAYDIMYEKSDNWHWLESCVALGRVYTLSNDLDKGMEYIKRAKDTAEKINSIEHLAEINLTLSKIYERRGEYKTSLEYFKLYKINNDELINDKEKNNITEHRIKYINSSKQDKIHLLQQDYDSERKIKKIFIYSTISLLIALTFIVALFAYIIKVKNRSRMQLAKAENAQRTFFTNITHEFRTPLTVIMGLSEHLHKGELSPEETVGSISSMITRQSKSLLTLINQLLDISKIKSTISNPDWYRGDIVPYMQMLCDNYRYTTRQKQIELHFVSKQNKIVVDFVPDYLRKVMSNLLSNAIKFTPEHGKIYVTVSLEKNNINIVVADTGKGISEKDLSHIFDVYYQSANNQSGLGSGVGLYLVKLIIKNIGGDITVKSNLGKGSVFLISVPIKRHEAEIKELKNTDNTINSEFNLFDKDISELPCGITTDEDITSVLIVEDNHDVAYYIGSELRNRYRLYYSDNGKDGLNTAMDIVPDLIITDIMMPEMDGYELCKAVRDSDLLCHVPIIVITARSTEEDRIKGIRAGADAYLFKPFNSDELNARVENILELRKIIQNKTLKCNDTDVNTYNKEITENDKKFLAKVVDVTYRIMSSGNISCEMVAEELNITSRQLNRKITALTGENSSVYITSIRLNRAIKMLDSRPELMINEIAYMCGFEDNAYFSRIFKKHFGITPSQHRKTPPIQKEERGNTDI